VGDAEGGQIGGHAGGICEPESGVKLNPVGGRWSHLEGFTRSNGF
jgi:hypothetical protein